MSLPSVETSEFLNRAEVPGLVATAPSSLNTPMIMEEGVCWPNMVGNSIMETCGLFDELNTEMMPPNVDPMLTSCSLPEIGDEALEMLDPFEVEELLEQIQPNPTSNVEPDLAPNSNFAPNSYFVPESPRLTDAPTTYDHDYCDPDWKVLSEFMDLSAILNGQNCHSEFSPSAQIDPASFLQAEPTFLDTQVDLASLLAQEEEEEEEGENIEDIEESEDVESVSTPVRNEKYLERRRKNNAASRISRKSRKERRVAMEAERVELESQNADLKAKVIRLEALTTEWRERLLQLVAK